MKAEDQLIDALLREQARDRNADEALLARIERGLDASESRARRSGRGLRTLLAAAAAITLAAVVFHLRQPASDESLAERSAAPAPPKSAETPRDAGEVQAMSEEAPPIAARSMMAAETSPAEPVPRGRERLAAGDAPPRLRAESAALRSADAATNRALNPWRRAATRPESRIELRGEHSGFFAVREAILADAAVDPDTVRIEDAVNHLRYRFEPPREAIGLITEVTSCPWNPGHRLARVALHTGAGGPPVADVRLAVRFDPAGIDRYRLLGHPADGKGPPEPADLPPGHQVTALYEISPADADANDPSFVASAAFRPGSGDRQVVSSKPGETTPWAATDPGFRLAAAAAACAMKLRQAPEVEAVSWEELADWARPAAETTGANEAGRSATAFAELLEHLAAKSRAPGD
jgi:hypothetical protein